MPGKKWCRLIRLMLYLLDTLKLLSSMRVMGKTLLWSATDWISQDIAVNGVTTFDDMYNMRAPWLGNKITTLD